MKLFTHSLFASIFACLVHSALAQTGTLDQVSPTAAGSASATFNGDATSLTWQAQFTCGLAGQLEGFTLQLTGAAGATLQTGLRIGPGWNTTSLVFSSVVTKTTSATEDVFVNVTSAGISVLPGQKLVIELTGLGTGTWMNGSYVDPVLGPPLYPDPLFLGGPGCFAGCGWRIGFSTYVLVGGPPNLFCFGDGTGTACPCGNASAVGANEGCLNSIGIGGRLRTSGTASLAADTLTLTASNLPGNVPTLFFQGTAQVNGGAGLAFGDGLRCAGGTIIRLGIHPGVGNVATYPIAGDIPIGLRGLCISGNTYHYQSWYRNAATFCTPSTFNLTNGATVQWAP